MPGKRAWFVVALCVSASLIGCASRSQTTKSPFAEPIEGTVIEPKSVELYWQDTESPSIDMIMGGVLASKKGGAFAPGEHALDDKLKIAAAELGGDAVIEVRTTRFHPATPESDTRCTYGLAVRKGEGGAKKPAPRESFIVSLLPLQIQDPEVDEEEASKAREAYRQAAEYYLEKLGYHAHRNDQFKGELNPENLPDTPEGVLVEAAGPWADRILFAELRKSSGGNIGIVSSHKAEVRISMISVSDKKVLLDNTSSAAQSAAGLVPVLFGAKKGIAGAVTNAVEKWFEHMAPIYDKKSKYGTSTSQSS